MESANYQRVATVAAARGQRRGLQVRKTGPARGAKRRSGRGQPGRGEKKVSLEDRVLRSFAKKKFANRKIVRTCALAFERSREPE